MGRPFTESICISLFVLLVTIPPAPAGELISELTDPLQPECEGCVDILYAWIEQDGGLLTFSIQTRESIPQSISDPNEHITFLWLVDADNDPNTGQPHEQVGTEFNVRVCINDVFGGGFVDVTGGLPGGGPGTVLITDNLVQITIGLGQIANPTQFHWACDAFHVIDNVAVSANHETDVAVANTLPYTPPAHVALSTPLLMLALAGPTTGQLEVEIRDATGNLLPTGDYHLTFSSSNEAVATVDDTGLVTAHAVPVQFQDTPYVQVWADGVAADNSAIIRVTNTDLGVAHETYAGANISFYIVPVIEGVNLAQITADFQVVTATDLAYAAQAELMDATPFQGGRHYFVLDVADDPVTVPCGISGNPVRLGWLYGEPMHNSCYIVNDPQHRVPQWGVFFHEMGHNFTWRSWGFAQFCSASETYGWMYSEAFASMAGAWSWYRLTRCAPEIDPANVESIAEHFPNIDPSGRVALHEYQAAGANYSEITVEVICDILWDMYDDYTAQVWYDVFSTFVPADDPLPVVLDNDVKQATWLVAALSASASDDLRTRFTNDYGFPIDNAAWPDMLAAAEARVTARPWLMPTPGDFDCDGDVDTNDYRAFKVCFASSGGGPVVAGCAAGDLDLDGYIDCSDWAEFKLFWTGPPAESPFFRDCDFNLQDVPAGAPIGSIDGWVVPPP
ncbi:MAG: Ig-like domain-containing protein [Planctomycetes bacterium]|nr:Ig-like domain-containing protein [Planctomycetota bacterium]